MPGMLVIHVETHSLFPEPTEHLHQYSLPHSRHGNQSWWVARCDCLQKTQHLSYCPIASVTLTEGYSVSKIKTKERKQWLGYYKKSIWTLSDLLQLPLQFWADVGTPWPSRRESRNIHCRFPVFSLKIANNLWWKYAFPNWTFTYLESAGFAIFFFFKKIKGCQNIPLAAHDTHPAVNWRQLRAPPDSTSADFCMLLRPPRSLHVSARTQRAAGRES